MATVKLVIRLSSILILLLIFSQQEVGSAYHKYYSAYNTPYLIITPISTSTSTDNLVETVYEIGSGGGPGPLESPAQKLTPTSTLSPTDDQESYNVKPTETMSFYSIETQGIHSLDSTETSGMDTLGTNTEYVISIGLLATALMVCIVVFIIVTSIILIRSKAKLEAALQQSASQGETIHVEPMYEDITRPLPSESVINTQDNVAYGYGHVQTTIAR